MENVQLNYCRELRNGDAENDYLRCVHSERQRQFWCLWMDLGPIFKHHDRRHSVCIVHVRYPLWALTLSQTLGVNRPFSISHYKINSWSSSWVHAVSKLQFLQYGWNTQVFYICKLIVTNFLCLNTTVPIYDDSQVFETLHFLPSR